MLTPSLASAPLPMLQAIRQKLGPAFVNEQQRTFMRSTAPELLYSGAFRAGKSRIGCEKAYQLAKRYPGIPIGIFRKTAASLPATTERTLLHDVVPRSAIVKSNRSEHWYELANGSRIWLFGLDPDPITGIPSKVGSVELGFAFIDEAAEVTEADWVMVKGRLSWQGIPFHQIAAATNPASPTHWLKRRFTPSTETRQFLHASTFDNPSLPADYLAEAESMGDGYFRSRYILGEWVGAEGVIWTLPDWQIKSPTTPEFKAVHAGVDWGFVHAFACEVIGQSGSGRLAVIEEVYTRSTLLRDIIPALLDVQERHPGIMFYADPSEPAYIAECRASGLRMTEATNDVNAGIQAVGRAIADGMTVDPACAGLLGEIPGYTWLPSKDGFREKPIEVNDDACDALRYGVMSFGADPNNPWGSLAGKTASAVA